ncbi:hypothetical protein H072_2034 [Dactylellina haptotyla CBS 200.50]|uniref:C2H2-type domain-containing protein n=1 Tax=Dactylellina haptotyla (strain CBS 200.50) TaxID=1284197 RepID=S8BWX5_DACHA|nr:hypothetical protein H072_2034 [Dactylellina haptotyla CBS 200.50]
MADIYEVIRTAPEQHVRTILRLLCDNNFGVKSKAQELHSTIVALQENGSGDSKKRTRDAEVLFCLKCRDCYVEEDNDDEACAYHPGEFEADYDGFFADHDEMTHGLIDDEDMFEEYPEGYTMSCCQKRGNEEGCDIGRHINGGSQRAREEGPDGNGEAADEGNDDEEEDEDGEEEDGN